MHWAQVATTTAWGYASPACSGGDCSGQDEEVLAAALVKYGPISICINSGYQQSGDWALYTGGILSGSCVAEYTKIDHCVQLVGFDRRGDAPYWKVRNSWGDAWGEQGHIRLPYGAKNSCCVACQASIFTAHMN